MDAATLLVVDDHALFREVVRSVFARHPWIRVVGEAADAEEALEACRRLQPDLVLMDLGLPGTGGVETTRQLLAQQPELRVLALSAWDDGDSLLSALHAGAKGYVTKNGDYAQLVRSVEAVAAGHGFLSPEVTLPLLRYVQGAPRLIGRDPSPPAWLGGRERAILRLIASGTSNREIANELMLSEHTVRTYLTEILAKLGLENRVQLAMYALKVGVA